MSRMIALCLVALAFAATAQADYANFVDAMNSESDFSRIKQAADLLGLSTTFKNPQLKVTIFVPNNGAFDAAQKAFPGVTMDVLQRNKALLQQMVYYHIAREVVRAPLPKRSFDTYISGKQLTGDGNTIKGIASSAQIVKPNVVCGQGVAHGINNVLLFINLGSVGRR